MYSCFFLLARVSEKNSICMFVVTKFDNRLTSRKSKLVRLILLNLVTDGTIQTTTIIGHGRKIDDGNRSSL